MIFLHTEIDRCIAAKQPVKYSLLYQIVQFAGGDEAICRSWEHYITKHGYIDDPSWLVYRRP